MSNPRLAEVPDRLLEGRPGRGATTQAARLGRWLDTAQIRPTLLELGQERNRRKAPTMNPAPVPEIPERVEAKALALIHDLSAVGGDEAASLEVLRDHAADLGGDIGPTAAVALWVTFGRCLPGPVAVPELDQEVPA